MLDFIFITIGVILNVICIWSITIMLKKDDSITWKNYFKYSAGIPAGIVLSLLLCPIKAANIALFAITGGIAQHTTHAFLPRRKTSIP